MAPLIETLSYKNADEQMDKLLEILQDIPKDESIKDRFDIKNSISGIVEQEIAI